MEVSLNKWNVYSDRLTTGGPHLMTINSMNVWSYDGTEQAAVTIDPCTYS